MMGFCLVLWFPSRNRHRIIVSVATSPYTLIQNSHSWSPLLCRLVLCNRVLKLLLILFIHICNIRLHVYIFLLVFFDLLAGKAFLMRSIKLCLVDNQRSSGVTVAWLWIVLIRSRIANVTHSTNQIYLYLSEDRAYSSSSGIRVRLPVRYYRIFSF